MFLTLAGTSSNIHRDYATTRANWLTKIGAAWMACVLSHLSYSLDLTCLNYHLSHLLQRAGRKRTCVLWKTAKSNWNVSFFQKTKRFYLDEITKLPWWWRKLIGKNSGYIHTENDTRFQGESKFFSLLVTMRRTFCSIFTT